MEHGLGLVLKFANMLQVLFSLNPCFNGEYGLGPKKVAASAGKQSSLNPCSNGKWSRTRDSKDSLADSHEVLILV